MLFLFLLFFADNAVAQQYILKGKVVNQSKQPVEFVNITLLKDGQQIVGQSLTSELGTFLFKAEKGNYTLILEQFGKEYFNQQIELFKDTILGDFAIDSSVVLEGVTITSRKKLIEQKVDRMVFNVENSIASQGMSGLDALRNTPLVRIQNDNVSIVGKGGVAIMVNDRMLNLSGSELTNYLQSLRSEDIARIEVITTPPSKYEAQGNSGIINIILKKNPNLGWSGTLTSSYQRNSYNGFRTGANINYQSSKISSSIKIRQYDYTYKLAGTRNLLGTNNSILTTEARKDQAKAVGINYSLDYKINDKQNIGFIYDFNSARYNIDAEGKSLYQRRTVVDSILYTKQKQVWKTPTHTLNAYYDVKFDSLGKKLSFTVNYLSNIPDKVNDFNTVNNITSAQDVVRNNSKMNYSIYSGQADLILPFKWANVEVGTKYTLFNNNSNVGYYNLVGSDYVLKPDNSNVFNYKEHNYATYVSLEKNFNEKWSAKAGLRYEYTTLEGKTQGNSSSSVTDFYGKLFPTAYVSFKPNNDHAFSINYSKRINRPDFQSLNPFRWYTNTYMYYSGTPTLKPSFNDNVEFSYSFKGKLTAGLYNQYSSNNISNIARLENGIYSNIVENSYNQNSIGLRLGYYETFFRIWESSISANGYYTVTSPTIQEVEQLKVYSLSYSFYNTITLNKDKTWFLLLNFWHDLPFTYANIKMKDQIDFSPGIRASLLQKKLNISAVFSDVFRTLKNDGYSYNNGFRSEFYNYNDHRKLTLSISYAFGNNKVKGANKDIKFDEESRAN
ncbi:TonB-dependent receptor [Elizabethkingia anophelis]|uniref:TonB-dependent receptor n=1 Tax=Elizabethkingia anophelis TaxID=1117645 RepID=A0AAU8VJI4_9FLAO|nr:TonB-dependent receptor [Elizabethkingia anophelis]AQX03485.1 TonB-dependent receptor [Elizabethkingia anophelis]OPB58134.1 TonB-dependent receptor [Elizabethkingia anophelis]OPB58887.1 TonB-dependent receptor [Elizabethkingia anophelis]